MLRCVAIEYRDYPTVEWTLYFQNTGKQDSPVLADIKPLDIAVRRGQQGEFLLHHHAGSQANSDDYRPLEMDLRPGSHRALRAHGRLGLQQRLALLQSPMGRTKA